MSGPPLHGLVLIIGGRGSGKTTMLQDLEEKHRRACSFHPGHRCRFVVWDRLGHWQPVPARKVVRSASPEEAARVAIASAPCTLVLDEVALAFPAHNPPREGTALNEIVRVGRQACAVGEFRRKGPVAILAAAQRPANVHPDLRGLVDRLYLMHMSATNTGDLDWVAKVAGPDVAARLPQLRPPVEGVSGAEYLVVDCQ